ncbi:uncharacterized protein BJ212DRAFT_998613 [Suillus subaureus]|uniref:Uncharacterized protein n=1 Tax=Suillus subaureus TaxID=48587 RepID=A0A9P7DT32_9AGAM|nr:uncharacterized protein BJ212DRAFT_998613 [Suillus subaureus]KAG1802519.1 hypothetical protein BJ212DRAFT_998613 [Suillus subaureus]
MSQMPQLLACFLTRAPLRPTWFLQTESQTQAQQTYTSNSEHQLLCMSTLLDETCEYLVYIISTRIFFDLEGLAVATPISWNRWDPSHTRFSGTIASGKFTLVGIEFCRHSVTARRISVQHTIYYI